MIDFHTHCLPKIDDGSVGAKESEAMFEAETSDGVDVVIATPHFYYMRDSVSSFFSRRDGAVAIIKNECKSERPRIGLGAEASLFENMSRSDEIEKFCVTGTNVLLVEMPFCKWNGADVSELYKLKFEAGLNPVIAHQEKFFRYGNRKNLVALKKDGFLLQTNADFFIDAQTRKTALSMLEDGQIDIIGTDCHHRDVRRPNMGEAIKIITENGLETVFKQIAERTEELFKNAVLF